MAIGRLAERFPSYSQLPEWLVSGVNITPTPLRCLGKIDDYLVTRQLGKQVALARTRWQQKLSLMQVCLQLNKHLTGVIRLAEYPVKFLSSKLYQPHVTSVIVAYFRGKVNDFLPIWGVS